MRQLGLTSAAALVVANMVGAGVFTTTGFLMADLGSPSLVVLAWAVGGIIALAGALSYGAIARALPESGGEYLYLTKTLHPALGFVAGWVSLLAGFSAPLAAVGIGFGEYLEIWLPYWSPKWTGSLLLCGCAAIHFRHVVKGALFQNVIVILKVIALLGFIGYGVIHIADQPSVSVDPGLVPGNKNGFPLGVFAVSLVWISFSYAGWNAAGYIGSEVVNPDRNLPRSLVLGSVVVLALYVGANFVFVYASPAAAISGQLEVAQIAARHLGGATAETGVTVLIAVALATSGSAMMMAGPRVYRRMAEEGRLPTWLAQDGNQTVGAPPRRAVVLQLGLALAFLWTGAFQQLLTYIGFTLSLSNAAVVVGLLRHVRRHGAPLKIPGGMIAPAIFLAFTLFATGIAFLRETTECLLGAATVGLGLLAYQIQFRQNSAA